MPKGWQFHQNDIFISMYAHNMAYWYISLAQWYSSYLMLKDLNGAPFLCINVACLVPSHYLNQYWFIVNWILRNKLCEILIRIQTFPLKTMYLKMASAKWHPFCLGLYVLTHCGLVTPYGTMRTRSVLAQVMAYCLTAPSHYLNQCWLIIGEVPWHSSQGIILRLCEDTNQ